ncbi:Uncharacterized protein PECH_002667 [Penicillium ucsense]|uniref:Rab proteins geranylgeranyltransferase n=1 Tax=Penicillium ucsense TaxID=2839758 RepID=A0A8J8WIM9_9EURO|nr:Uncharacterized protein PECM_003616 [Penicillium ucsense]KAF7737838.1 Uncharacterized protein PECH_002667 [Penicillium ucsense]
MESLSEQPWDVIVAGTGLIQSLLALALSRSRKKVLHLDQNSLYGGSEAAFSLDEAAEWVQQINQHPSRTPFEDATIQVLPPDSDNQAKLAASRAYTLSLSPYFLYTRSELISVLISSKVYRQLEFMAVGSWWVCSSKELDNQGHDGDAKQLFHRVPGNREDIFSDGQISMKAKRTLMRFLRHISTNGDDEEQNELTNDNMSEPFTNYLSTKFGVPAELHRPLLSLSLSQLDEQQTSANFAVPRVKRHLASIGVLGPGFGAVVSKYGAGSEILQVACRASAVGGAVYALDTAIESLADEVTSDSKYPVKVRLSNGETVSSGLVFGSAWDVPCEEQPNCTKVARSITIASSSFASLFPVTVEGAPVPASVVLMFPGDTLDSPSSPPVYLQVHSSDTGDCPRQQSVIYGSISIAGSEGQALLERAVDRLLQAEGPEASALWSLQYTQLGRLANEGPACSLHSHSSHVFSFPPPSLDLAFEDQTVDLVKAAWVHVVGSSVPHDEFMIFEDREGTSDE